MSNISVGQFAAELSLSVKTLLTQLQAAGLAKTSINDEISAQDQSKLLDYLRQSRQNKPPDADCITLTRRKTTEIKRSDAAGKARTISVEVRKKRVFVKQKDADFRPSESEIAVLDVIDDKEKKLREHEERRQSELRSIQEAELKGKREHLGRLSGAQTIPVVPPGNAQNEPSPHTMVKGAAVPETVAGPPLAAVAQKDRPAVPENKVVGEKTDDDKTKKAGKPVAVVKKRHGGDWYEKPDRLGERKPAKKTGSSGKFVEGGVTAWSGRGVQSTLREETEDGVWYVKKSPRSKNRGEYGVFQAPTEPVVREVSIAETITVAELAHAMSIKAAVVIKALMKMGTMVTINQVIDQETAMIVVEDMGHKSILVKPDDPDALLGEMQDHQRPLSFIKRPPVVTVMGHVDHGKTSLLDCIRREKVALGEAGGITQHIGAYHVTTNRGAITFLDTPGHEAFTAMRARGAKLTDIVVLVVAADDGVEPQTIEAIHHARSANVPIVVAVNKVDKVGADPARIRQMLITHEIVAEEFGGETIFVNVSAKTGQNIDALLEAILLQAEMIDLQTPIDTPARCIVVEARLDKGKGPIATVLIQSGILQQGDMLLAGRSYGHVRAMINEKGCSILQASPSIPVEIQGLSDVPLAGVEAIVLDDDKKTREIALFRQVRFRELKLAQQAASKGEQFSQIGDIVVQIVSLVIKVDVQGSQEALVSALKRLSTNEVKVNIVHAAVGNVTESDINLAIASKSVVLGFNTKTDVAAKKIADYQHVSIRHYSIIYDAVDDMKKLMSGLLAPELHEKQLGSAEVRQVFSISKVGVVAGCFVQQGLLKRQSNARVLRDQKVVHEGKIESLKRFKEDVKEVKFGFECGLTLRNFTGLLAGDIIQAYEIEEIARVVS